MDKALGMRALVVEDDPAWQGLVAEVLTDIGLAVDVAEGLEAATQALREAPHRLAVVDLALGGDAAANVDGLRVLEAVRRQDPGCVTVLLTGYATVELAVSAITDYGALTCLRKATFDRAEFRRLVARALSSAPVIEPSPPSLPGVLAGPSREAEVANSLAPDTVLVVEDDASWRGILAELLVDAGYRVRLCNGYGEAAGCLRRETYRMAIVDLALQLQPWALTADQDLDGYQILALARDHNVTTIVVSGVAAAEEIERAYRDYGVFAYLEKQSFDRRAFLQAVAEGHTTASAGCELEALTARESEVLALLARGVSNKEIAETLVISTNTVKRHLRAIFDKLGVHTRAAAVSKAIGAGLSLESPP